MTASMMQELYKIILDEMKSSIGRSIVLNTDMYEEEYGISKGVPVPVHNMKLDMGKVHAYVVPAAGSKGEAEGVLAFGIPANYFEFTR